MYIYQLGNVHAKINGMIKNSPNISLSTLYREIRKDWRVGPMGDIVLTGELIIYVSKKGIHYNRQQIARSLRQTSEFSQMDKLSKIEILNYFEDLSFNSKERFKTAYYDDPDVVEKQNYD